MSESEKLRHLQAMLQITEYIDCMVRYNKDLGIDDFYGQPLPEIDTAEPTYESIEERLKRVINQQNTAEVSQPTVSIAPSIRIGDRSKQSQKPAK